MWFPKVFRGKIKGGMGTLIMHMVRNVTGMYLFVCLLVKPHFNLSKNTLVGVQREEPIGNQMATGQLTATDY